jgi:hypothetical protein
MQTRRPATIVSLRGSRLLVNEDRFDYSSRILVPPVPVVVDVVPLGIPSSSVRRVVPPVVPPDVPPVVPPIPPSTDPE